RHVGTFARVVQRRGTASESSALIRQLSHETPHPCLRFLESFRDAHHRLPYADSRRASSLSTEFRYHPGIGVSRNPVRTHSRARSSANASRSTTRNVGPGRSRCTRLKERVPDADLLIGLPRVSCDASS